MTKRGRPLSEDPLFAARSELLFAGGGRDASRVTSDDRTRVLAALEKFGRKNGKA